MNLLGILLGIWESLDHFGFPLLLSKLELLSGHVPMAVDWQVWSLQTTQLRIFILRTLVKRHQSGGQEKLKYLINVLWWPHLLVSLGRHVAANGGHSGWCSTRSLKVEGVFGEDRLESLSKYFDGVVGQGTRCRYRVESDRIGSFVPGLTNIKR